MNEGRTAVNTPREEGTGCKSSVQDRVCIGCCRCILLTTSTESSERIKET